MLLLKLPRSLNIGGAEVEINSGFHTSIQFQEVIKDKETLENKDTLEILNLYFPIVKNTTDNSTELEKNLCIKVLENAKEAYEKILWFYRCGEEKAENAQNEDKPTRDVFSYQHDSQALISDFKREYDIDLLETNLHWWNFKSYLNGLTENSEIKQRMKFRTVDITKVPKEQQEYYRRMKKAYEIPHDKEEIKKNSEIAAIFK